MQLRHMKTLHPPSEMVEGKFQKITAMAWSPNNVRLAVATADRYVILYDENGKEQDKFSTKAADPNAPRNYTVRGLEFSPDSTKLAVAQSDNIVFVYKLGPTWGHRKSICNKFMQNSPVTCICWPQQRHNELVYGLADGKVRVGILKSNKFATLFPTDQYVVSCYASPDGHSFVSGHIDGSIYRYNFPSEHEEASKALLVQTSFIPYSLGWGEHLVAAGNTGEVQFFDAHGGQVQRFDYSQNPDIKEFSCVSFNPSGQTVVLGNFDRFLVFAYNAQKDTWEETANTVVKNLYSVTAVRWKSDGSRLATGSLCGAVDTYDACVRRFLYMGKYEFTYTSTSSVICKRLSSGARMQLASRFGCEIKKINIYHDRYIAAHTPETLLLGDLKTCQLSEVPWNGSGKEKFFFDNERAAMVFNAGELSLVEYGKNEVLGSCRTEFMSPHVISVRISEARNAQEGDIKKIAYMLDQQAARVLDLSTAMAEATINHEVRIDWLELNQRGTKLLFRDKRRALHLYDVHTQVRVTLLNFCNYVQWVPDSDVVVAQSRRNLCVWYNVDNPSDVTITEIKGDVEEIERVAGRTEVVVDEGINTASYALDEGLIAFGAAIDARDFRQAVQLLEKLPPGSKSADAMWTTLSKIALEEEEFVIAERCFSALGDVSKTVYLRGINELVQQHGDTNHYLVRAKIAMLNKQFKRAEAVLLQQGDTDEAISIYCQLHKWESALAVAESKNHPRTAQLRQEYFNYLVSTKQEEVAGTLKEKEGDYHTALQLYLRGGFPARASQLILQQGYTQDQGLVSRVADDLHRTKQFEEAGEFLEALKQYKRALEAYCRGNAYHRAVELSRHAFPSQVVRLEEEWGDWLVSQKQMDAACNHYIQAGAGLKAINAAIEARQWTKAVQILNQLDPTSAQPFYKRIARHFAETNKYDDAEKYYIQGGLPQEAVQMLTTAGFWDRAHKIAVTYMPEAEVGLLYVTQAQLMESQGKFKDAERLYLTVNEPDLAINMYKKNRRYDDMVRLVGAHRQELLNDTHLHLAHQFETEGNFKMAEKHFILAKEWKPAVSMYRENDMWEDTLRVAKTHGGMNAYKQVAYAFAVSQGGDAGVKQLAKRGLGEQAVDYAIERGEFTEAFHIAEKSCKHKLPEVHLQYAMALEDEGRFERAEEEFIKAKKPKEAMDMYMHQQKWDAAMRVAELHEPAGILDICEAQGRAAMEQKNYQAAEEYFLSAKKPEVAIKMYREAKLLDDALRLAKIHAPRLSQELQQRKLQEMERNDAGGAGGQSAQQGQAGNDTAGYLASQAKMLLQQRQYSRAIDAYLRITRQHTQDHDSLARAWETAARLALDYDRPRVPDVITEVSIRMCDIGRFDKAAELKLATEDYAAAVDCFVRGGMFDKARLLAQHHTPQLLPHVEKQHQDSLLRSGQIREAGELNPDAALEEYVKRGEWDKGYDFASKHGDTMVGKLASIHAGSLAKDGRFTDALAVFTNRGAPVIPVNFTLYKRIAEEVLRQPRDPETQKDPTPSHQELRDLLYKLVNELREVDPQSHELRGFERLLMAAHLSSLRMGCKRMGLVKLAAKNATSMLRFTVELPVDKAFHDAGEDCKAAGWMNMSFVFFNRFVDLTDLMEEPDSGDIDNSDFLITDIPSPFDVPLPQSASFSEEEREDVREFVLEKAMSSDIEQSLNMRQCDNCGTDTYEAGVTCHNCQCVSETCIVTGYPVARASRIACRSCQRPANKDDWNNYVVKMKTCPWCASLQNPFY